MTSKDQLRKDIDAFLVRSGMSQTRFGIEALNDRTFMHRLNSGSDVRMETADKIRQFMRDWRPSGPLARRRLEARAS